MAQVELIRYYHGLHTEPETEEEPVAESSPALAAGPPTEQEEPHSDARTIHVSSSGGSDRNRGTRDDPLRTVAAAAELLRDGHGDQLLLRRGDVWAGGAASLGGAWRIGGRSAEYPMVFGWYGDADDPMPAVEMGGNIHWLRLMDGSRGFITVAGIRFYSSRHDPAHPGFDPAWAMENKVMPVRVQTGAERIVVDGCVFEHTAALYAQGGRSLAVRNSVVFNHYAGVPHAQGVFAHEVDGLLIEGNVFDANGYNFEAADLADADPGSGLDGDAFRPTFHNHAIYTTASTRNVLIRGNVIARSSSMAIKRGNPPHVHGRDIIDNLLIANGNNFGAGGEDTPPEQPSTIRGNVLLHGGAHLEPDGFTTGGGPNAFGIQLDGPGAASGNILAHNPLSYHHAGIRYRNGGADGGGNIIYAWGRDTPTFDPEDVAYPDPDRTIERYVAEVLGVPVDSREHAVEVFMTGARVGAAGCDAASVIEWVRRGFGVSGSALSGG